MRELVREGDRNCAYWTLRHVGMSDRQANRKLEEGFEYLQRGGFEQDGFTVWPLITPEKVGELLRYWKKTPEREAYLAALKAARSARRGRVDKNG